MKTTRPAGETGNESKQSARSRAPLSLLVSPQVTEAQFNLDRSIWELACEGLRTQAYFRLGRFSVPFTRALGLWSVCFISCGGTIPLRLLCQVGLLADSEDWLLL